MSFLDQNNIDIRKLQNLHFLQSCKFAFFTKGLVHTFGQNLKYPHLVFLIEIVQKEYLETSLTQKTFPKLQKR